MEAGMDPKMLIVGTELDKERELYYLPWADLRRWLRIKCARANKNPWIRRLDPNFALTFHRTNDTELTIVYRCKTGEYAMYISYYHRMRGFNYRMEDEPFILNLRVTDPHGRAPFGTRDRQSLTVAQAGRRVLSVLLNSSNAAADSIC
jgi:hypothetical protein